MIFRNLIRHPSQSLIILSTVAIGVAASGLFYSVADTLLVRPLPFDRAGRLLDIAQRLPPSGSRLMNSHENLNQLREPIRFARGGSRGRFCGYFSFARWLSYLLAGVAGMALTWAVVSPTRNFLLDLVPYADQIALNMRVLCFSAGVVLATGIFFGVWPALAATNRLHEFSLAAPGIPAARPILLARSRTLLVSLQLAFSASFLLVTGLLGVSLYHLLRVDIGVQVSHRLAVLIKPAAAGPKTLESTLSYFSRFEEQLLSLPGVQSVAASSDLPLGVHPSHQFRIKDKPKTGPAVSPLRS